MHSEKFDRSLSYNSGHDQIHECTQKHESKRGKEFQTWKKKIRILNFGMLNFKWRYITLLSVTFTSLSLIYK